MENYEKYAALEMEVNWKWRMGNEFPIFWAEIAANPNA